MKHRVTDYTDRDLAEALKSPNFSEAKKEEFRQEIAAREEIYDYHPRAGGAGERYTGPDYA